MAAKLVKTNTPGIYRRHATTCDRNGCCDCSYVVVYDSKARTFGTMDEAREGKRIAQRQSKLSKAHAAGLHQDEPRDECPDCERERQARDGAEPLLHDYSREVIARYIGTSRRGYREETRDEDRRLLERYALAYFAPEVRLRDVGPMQIAEFIGWLCRRPSKRGGALADRSVRNALKPVRIVLATARREGLIAHNPASDAVLPHREELDDDEELPRPFLGDTMKLVVSLIHPRHREMFEVLAATGVRRSELLAFEVRHLALDGDRPHIKVRQRVRRRNGIGLMVGPLKSRYARRDLPMPLEVADRLRSRVTGRGERELVFRSTTGTILDPDKSGRAGSRAGVLASRRRVGRLSHLQAYRGEPPVRRGPQRGAGAALARPPQPKFHARHVRPPALRRSGRTARAARPTFGLTGPSRPGQEKVK